MHIDTESGFAVYQHLLVDDRAPDYWQILAVAKAYAAETNCRINPEIMPQAVAARLNLFEKRVKKFFNKHIYTFFLCKKQSVNKKAC